MRKLFYINDTIANKISYWHLVGFLVALPFDFFYSEIILVSFGIHTLINLKRSYLKNLYTKEVWIPASIYIAGVLSILYSSDKAEGLNIATRQLAIFLFPVLFSINSIELERYSMKFSAFFILTCTVTILYLYFDAFHTMAYFHLPYRDLFTLAFMNHNFSLPIELHATYLSLYVSFSIIALTYLLIREKSSGLKYIYTGCMAILVMGMLQLSSRAVFIALLVVMNVVFPVIVLRGKRRIRFMTVSILLSCLIVFGIMRIDSFKVRYVSELKKDLTQKLDLIEINEPRITRWKATLEIIKGSPIIGYGLGSEKKLLKEKYFQEKLFNSYLNEFNTHDEYLSFLLKNGILGLALFLYVLYFGFADAWHKKDPMFLSFMILVSIVCISENLLDLNKGIFFYTFFFSVFLAKKKVGIMPETGNLKP
jgi:O-antigen ligase